MGRLASAHRGVASSFRGVDRSAVVGPTAVKSPRDITMESAPLMAWLGLSFVTFEKALERC